MTVSWDLTDAAYGGTSTDGTKTVYAQFHDRTGKWSDTVTDTILLDRGGGGGGGTATPYTAAITADNPAGFWRLGETGGTTAADFTGAFPGTYVNAPALGSASLLPADDRQGGRLRRHQRLRADRRTPRR